MELERIYYQDPLVREFAARVLDCRQTPRGWEVDLDRTAFYPGGGGQHCDTGFLSGVRVLEAWEADEQVVHLCDAPLAVGDTVTGRLDYDRRLDGMQQHTGEHILAGLIFRQFGYHNVGFHMGAEFVEVDFDGTIPPDALEDLERRANQLVWQNIPLRTWTPAPEELPGIPYRTKKDLQWPVRLVQIPGVDCCACCGVHTASTGQVGLIKVLSCVKFHQGVRLEVVCGGRAYDYVNQILRQNRLISHTLSAPMLETASAAVRLQEQLSREKFRATGLEKRVLGYISESYVNSEDVVHIEPALEPGAVRALAEQIAGRCSGVAVVLGGDAPCNLCAIGDPERVRVLGEALRRELRARGGGRNGAFQGSVDAPREQIEAVIRKVLQ